MDTMDTMDGAARARGARLMDTMDTMDSGPLPLRGPGATIQPDPAKWDLLWAKV